MMCREMPALMLIRAFNEDVSKALGCHQAGNFLHVHSMHLLKAAMGMALPLVLGGSGSQRSCAGTVGPSAHRVVSCLLGG